ncbi:MAG TPA: hypothetical protein VKT33_15125 [Candidatus Angelobacter sp.]|nr:hypothetical protein [Candidatus Angelobacter sp.]
MRSQAAGVICVVFLLGLASIAQRPTIESLKTQAEGAKGGQQAKLYAELAEALVDVAARQFEQDNSAQGQATVNEVLGYGTKARDAAVSSRSKMKETEIHLRNAQRKLEDLKRTLSADDRTPLDEVEKKLAQFREDILNTMFAPPKKVKK